MSLWGISPPQKQLLLQYLLNTSTDIKARFSTEFDRNEPKLPGSLYGTHVRSLSTSVREQLASIVNGSASAGTTVVIPKLIPQFLHVLTVGNVDNLAGGDSMVQDLTLRFQKSTNGQELWWEVENTAYPSLPPRFEIISDNIPAISSLSSYGIIGLYIAVVFAAGRFIRILITDLTSRIIYEDLPQPDILLKMCSDIILAREFGDFETEETLYWRLINLYRSPETLIEATKFKED